MPDSALTQGNGIDLTITGTTANPSTDAIRALCRVIDDYEDRVASGETSAALTGGQEIVVVQAGDNPYVLHKFQFVIGTDYDAQTYVVDYVGSAGAVDDLPATPSAPTM